MPVTPFIPYSSLVNAAAQHYAPSWYDRFQTWVERWARPAWAFYLIAALITAVALNGLAWLTGFLAIGTFDAYLSSGAAYLVIGYFGMHMLDSMAERAWAAFRPAARLGDPEADRFVHELTTMRAGPASVAAILGVVAAVVFVIGQYGRPFDLAGEPILFLASVVVIVAGFVGTAGFFYHSLHQLRLIGRAHRFVDSIDLLYLEPLHALARVTGATGIVLLAIGYLAIPTNPVPLDNPAVTVTAVAATLLAIVCFAWPLIGMRDAIAAEKSRRLEAVNGLLADRLGELHRRAAERDLTDADALNTQLSSLLAERALITAAPTWPWAPQTIRGFGAAIVIPIVLLLVNRFFERVL